MPAGLRRGDSIYPAFVVGLFLIEASLLKYNCVTTEVLTWNWMVYKNQWEGVHIAKKYFFQIRAYDTILAGSSCCKTSNGTFWWKDASAGFFCHSWQNEKDLCGSCPNNSILKILGIIINHCPLRIHLKVVFLKSSEFCVWVGSFPSVSSALLILAGIDYNKTTGQTILRSLLLQGIF